MKAMSRSMLQALITCALLVASGVPAWAQDAGMPSASLPQQSLRPYWHVFIAYAIAIALVLLWVLSISRRLRDVEERMRD